MLNDSKTSDFVEFVEGVPFGHSLGAIETLAALTAPVWAIRQEEQDPKFQEASAFGAMHMVAATQRTIPFLSVYKQTKCAFHWQRMIAPGERVCNRLARRCSPSGTSANQNDASTCIAWCRSLPRLRFIECARGKNENTGGRRIASRSRPIFKRRSWGA